MSKKVAIITHYYKSFNYGGNLQAYALTKKILELGFDVEQICFDSYGGVRTGKIKKILKMLNPKFAIGYFKNKKTQKKISSRFFKISQFNNQAIPHTKKIYNEDNIFECENKYDAFITGSDQVWNLKWYYPAYFLQFAPSDKVKFSYAASMSMQDLDDEQKSKIKEHLSDYCAISVREKDTVNLLNDLVTCPIEWVLDPTLLLSKAEWDLLSSKRIVDSPYVFCYFLGNDQNERDVAEKFAEENGLTLVTLPYLGSKYRKCDNKFGDVQLFATGIEDFISLIKHAEYIFTDSFHATVFSSIFEKQYFVFQRKAHKGMGSRIYTLCELFESTERFCDTEEKACLEYINSLNTIDYTKSLEMLLEMKEKSINYLKENLKRI